jgi:hypothetical protein
VVIGQWQESEEEHRVRLQLPNKRFEVGECPYGCIDLKAKDLFCGCNQHHLSGTRSEVVHLFGRHWNGTCAFNHLTIKLQKIDKGLRKHKEAWQILFENLQPPSSGNEA